jgi:hypothetical protein
VDRLYLRVPVEITHVINDDSPLAAWRHAGGVAEQDSFSEIIVVVRGIACLDALACDVSGCLQRSQHVAAGTP